MNTLSKVIESKARAPFVSQFISIINSIKANIKINTTFEYILIAFN